MRRFQARRGNGRFRYPPRPPGSASARKAEPLARYDGGSHHLASDEAGMLSQCADELEAALTSSPSGAQDVIPSKPEQP